MDKTEEEFLHIFRRSVLNIDEITAVALQLPDLLKTSAKPLFYVCQRADPPFEIVQFLLNEAAEPSLVGTLVRDTRERLPKLKTPLYAACLESQGSAESAAVIRLLVETWPQAVSVRSETFLRDRFGLPLHVLLCPPVAQPRMEDNLLFETVQCIAKLAPEAISIPTQGDYPIHVACDQFVPLNVLQQLVEACPQTLSERNRDGRLPLHIACHRAALHRSDQKPVSQVIEYVLQCGPEDASFVKDKDGNLPIHLACYHAMPECTEVLELLMERLPKGMVDEANENGYFPLHSICFNRDLAPETLEILLRHRPETIHAEGFRGWYPIQLLCRYSQPPETLRLMFDTFDSTDVDAATRERECEGLIQLAFSGTELWPSESLLLLLDRFPEQVRDHDKKGWLPLHCALDVSSSWYNNGNTKVVDRLLELYPADEFHRDMMPREDRAKFGGLLQKTRGSGSVHYPAELLACLYSQDTSPIFFALKNDFERQTVLDLCMLYPDRLPFETNPENGQLPLHAICQYMCEAQVKWPEDYVDLIHAFRKLNPPGVVARDNQGNLPVHYACAIPRIHVYPLFLTAVTRKSGGIPWTKRNRTGKLPLHILLCKLKWWISHGLISATIDRHPASVNVKTKAGDLPIHCLFKSSRDLVTVTTLFAESRVNTFLHLVRRLRPRGKQFVQNRQHLEQFLLDSSTGDTLLHLACRFIPAPKVIQYLLVRFPESVQKPNKSGELPFHIACEQAALFHHHPVFKLYTLSVVRLLLEAWPEVTGC